MLRLSGAREKTKISLLNSDGKALTREVILKRVYLSLTNSYFEKNRWGFKEDSRSSILYLMGHLTIYVLKVIVI